MRRHIDQLVPDPRAKKVNFDNDVMVYDDVRLPLSVESTQGREEDTPQRNDVSAGVQPMSVEETSPLQSEEMLSPASPCGQDPQVQHAEGDAGTQDEVSVSENEVRRSSRRKKPPTWMKDYC